MQTGRRLLDDCFLHDKDRLKHREALSLLKERLSPVANRETLPLQDASGRYIAQEIVSAISVPPASNSAVDGYAFAHDSYLANAGKLTIRDRIAAGDNRDVRLLPGEAARIFTGAVMPEGADTVAMQEDCETRQDSGSITVLVPSGLKSGANRRKAGEDLRPGDMIAAAGSLLDPQRIAALASIGTGAAAVFAPLRVAVLSSGNELLEPGVPSGPGKIYDTNRHMLRALLNRLPVTITDLGILPDDPDRISGALLSAAETHDAIIASGGTSRGEEDHIVETLDRIGKRHLWQLAVKPGRPMSFGQIGDCAFFGLPGNPVACMVCYLLYIRPALIRLAGGEWSEPRRFPLPAGFDIAKKKTGRREFWRGHVETDGSGRPALRKFERDGSGLITGLRQSEGLIEVAEDISSVTAGDMLDFIPWSEFGI